MMTSWLFPCAPNHVQVGVNTKKKGKGYNKFYKVAALESISVSLELGQCENLEHVLSKEAFLLEFLFTCFVRFSRKC